MRKITILLILLFSSVFLIADLYLNDSDPVFPPNPPDPSSVLKIMSGGRQEISDLLIEGAALYIESFSEALLLLKEYEMSGKAVFDLNLSTLKTETAIKKLEASRKCYESVILIGERLEYVGYYRNKLLGFDFDSYIKSQNLNPIIANEVKEFLKAGDVIGLYRRNLERIDEILKELKSIDEDLSKNIKSDISKYWRLFQKYSETSLFGNYATVLSVKAFNI